MELEKIRQHTAGTILQFSLSAIIAMVLTSLITVVDGFFYWELYRRGGNCGGQSGAADYLLIFVNRIDGIRRRGCDCGNAVRCTGYGCLQSGFSADNCDHNGILCADSVFDSTVF